MKEHISGYAFTDAATTSAMNEIYEKHQYIMDPHGAVAYLAWKSSQEEKGNDYAGILLETAHPAKFLEDVERILNLRLVIPKKLADLADRKKIATPMGIDYPSFRSWLVEHLD